VRDTIYTRALLQAAEAQGGTHALAGLLHVPENTLQRWMSGRAQTPVEAFCKAIDLLVEHEKRNSAASIANQGAGSRQALQFSAGELLARCVGCGGAQFALVPPATLLMYKSELRCHACGSSVTHGTLVATLARAAVRHAHRKG
jgi:DNA-binding transcriptional regulator YdaS (Cro superfamily)